jgi:hypothetical protein
LIDLISQLFELTVKTSGLAEPASTVIISPLWEAPKATTYRQCHQQISREGMVLTRQGRWNKSSRNQSCTFDEHGEAEPTNDGNRDQLVFSRSILNQTEPGCAAAMHIGFNLRFDGERG